MTDDRGGDPVANHGKAANACWLPFSFGYTKNQFFEIASTLPPDMDWPGLVRPDAPIAEQHFKEWPELLSQHLDIPLCSIIII